MLNYRNRATCENKIEHLQEAIKIYLMAVGGSTIQLGGLACTLVDILSDVCGGDYDEAARRLDNASILLIRTIYLSAIERMEALEDPAYAGWMMTQKRMESETELLMHVAFLKSVIVDLSIATKSDHTALSQKLEEFIHVLRS